MKILLINPASGFYPVNTVNPLGLLSIGSYMQNKGYDVKINDRNIKRGKFKKTIKSYSPDVAGLSVKSNLDISDALKISKHLKKQKIPVVWGGPASFSFTEMILDTGAVDAIVMGEGEETFFELIEAYKKNKPLDGVKGIAYAENGAVHYTGERGFIDLSSLPPLDWALLNIDKYNYARSPSKKAVYLYMSKGCPGRCTFCFNSAFHKSVCRSRPAAVVLDEMEYLIKNHGVDGVYFSDEILQHDNIMALCGGIEERNIKIYWGGQTKIGLYSKEEFERMYKAGCRWLFFGVESGSEKRLKEIKKGIEFGRVTTDIINCDSAGIQATSGFMVNYPDETADEVRETIKFAMNPDLNYVNVNIYAPVPDSKMYDYLLESKKYSPLALKKIAKFNMNNDMAGVFGEVTKKELLVIKHYFDWLFFTGKNKGSANSNFNMTATLIKMVLMNVFSHGLITFAVNSFSSARTLLTTLWYVAAYPGIRKKFGLSLNRKTRK
ncbi:MAG: B12-binding domain-containing radical SAM protein [Oscillospiraceae bacterium]|nr:B12-binding domain-containing radical SAM protein [Oscillospiraceae bacterium]